MLKHFKSLVRRALLSVDRALPLHRIARSALLSAIYLHLRGVYRHEQSALLSGLSTYKTDVRDGDPLFRLRRNIHRIEKGLSSTPRREVFAESYIADTVHALRRVVDLRGVAAADPTITWACDVLDAYFLAVRHTEAIEAARLDFETLPTWPRRDGRHEGPYRYARGEPTVSPADLRALAEERVSVRSYRDREVDHALIDAAVDIAMQSPSACNRLPYEFRFYDDRDIRPRLVNLAPGMAGWGHTAPVVCVLVGKYRAYFHARDRHAIYVDASLASMAFQMALVTMGLGSCSVNWPQLPDLDRNVGRLLNLDADEKVIMIIALGHPHSGGMVPYSGKRSMDEIRSYNRL